VQSSTRYTFSKKFENITLRMIEQIRRFQWICELVDQFRCEQSAAQSGRLQSCLLSALHKQTAVGTRPHQFFKKVRCMSFPSTSSYNCDLLLLHVFHR